MHTQFYIMIFQENKKVISIPSEGARIKNTLEQVIAKKHTALHFYF